MRMDSHTNPLGCIARYLIVAFGLCAWSVSASPARGQESLSDTAPEPKLVSPGGASGGGITTGNGVGASGGVSGIPGITQLPDLSNRQNVSTALQLVILLTVLSLAPAILLMMTSFTRIIIVLSLLRQAMGVQQLPPNQVLVGLALFMTFLVMGPTLNSVGTDAVGPYLKGDIDPSTALARGQVPLREFMIKQIKASGNESDVDLFTDFAHQPRAKTFGEVGTMTLVPAYMISELKTAFYLGFRVYLPFLIIDMVISSVLISMGMMMLPPVLISLPFKLLLFVLVDGWHLITQNLMGSFSV